MPSKKDKPARPLRPLPQRITGGFVNRVTGEFVDPATEDPAEAIRDRFFKAGRYFEAAKLSADAQEQSRLLGMSTLAEEGTLEHLRGLLQLAAEEMDPPAARAQREKGARTLAEISSAAAIVKAGGIKPTVKNVQDCLASREVIINDGAVREHLQKLGYLPPRKPRKPKAK